MKTFPRCSCRSTWSCYMTGEKICCTVPVSCLPKDTAFDFILEQMYYWSCASQLSWTKCQPAMVITVGSDFSGLECLSWACGNLRLKWETVNVQLFFSSGDHYWKGSLHASPWYHQDSRPGLSTSVHQRNWCQTAVLGRSHPWTKSRLWRALDANLVRKFETSNIIC